MIIRAPQNPIIVPSDVVPSRDDFQVLCAFNPGVIRQDDEILLLIRVAECPKNYDKDHVLTSIYNHSKGSFEVLSFDKHDKQCDFSDSRAIDTPKGRFLTSISHFRLARSKDGINFTIDKKPTILPESQYETFGIEDPRITKIDDTYYINYSAVSPFGITTALASTKDFKSFTRHGNIFCPDNKDVTIFPEKIGGKYYALHRPSTSSLSKPEIWIAESNDLLNWGNHKHLCGVRQGFWDSGRIGASAVPFRVPGGWIEIYHGANANDEYCLGVLLLDENEPWKVLARSEKPILKPEADYEKAGFFGNVVFSCGALAEDGLVKIYYGASDEYIGYAEIKIKDTEDLVTK